MVSAEIESFSGRLIFMVLRICPCVVVGIAVFRRLTHQFLITVAR